MGDFNSIRSKEDRFACNYYKRDKKAFNEFIDNHDLIEMVGANYSYTWFGPNNKKSKLDRVVVNSAWISMNNWKVVSWNWRNSDHSPISLISDETDWGPKPFKAFDWWRKEDNVVELFQQVITRNKDNHWFGIMKKVKSGLKQWYRNKGGIVENQIKDLENQLVLVDSNSNNHEERIRIFGQLQKAYHREFSQWKQKARMQWDLEGDYNTRFFQLAIKKRRCYNQISKIVDDGVIYVDPKGIKDIILDNFMDFYCPNLGSTPFNLSNLHWSFAS